MKILIIEDEAALRDTIAASLEQEQYIVETAHDYDSALEKTGIYEYDCILLDIGLPGGSGLSILEELKKENKNDGVIIISAKNSLDDKVTGLDLGADDYLPKPFHMAELLARVRSLFRRKKMEGRQWLVCGHAKIDADQRIVEINNEPLTLNRKEFDILLYMVVNKNRLVHKTALAEHVWGDHIDEANSFDFIYSQIKNLRRKLKETDAGFEIQAIYGVGYKLVAE